IWLSLARHMPGGEVADVSHQEASSVFLGMACSAKVAGAASFVLSLGAFTIKYEIGTTIGRLRDRRARAVATIAPKAIRAVMFAPPEIAPAARVVDFDSARRPSAPLAEARAVFFTATVAARPSLPVGAARPLTDALITPASI